MLEIVQTWKTAHSLPSLFEESRRTWRENHPDATLTLFDDDFVWGWLGQRQSEFPGAIHQGKNPVRTVDMFRYCYLLHNRGLFVDLDFYSVKPVDDLLIEYPDHLILGSVWMPPSWKLWTIHPCWIYSPGRGHPLWLVVLDLATNRATHEWIEYATGPILLYDAVQLYLVAGSGENLRRIGRVAAIAERCEVRIPDVLPPVKILEPEVLYPLSFEDPAHKEVIYEFRAAHTISPELLSRVPVTDATLAFTYWYHSWEPDHRRGW